VYYTGGSILLDNMQPLMSKADIKGTHLNDPEAQAAWAGDGGGVGARAPCFKKESNYRSITIAESCRQAVDPANSPERNESVDNYAVNN
jgi:hypothetical protein